MSMRARAVRGLQLVRLTPIDVEQVSKEELERAEIEPGTGIELFELSEGFSYANDVANRPIEDGAEITDHINISPITVSISFVVKANARRVNDILLAFRNSRGVFRYEGVDRIIENAAITGLDIPRNSSIEDGFEGSISLQQVWIIEEDDAEVLGEDEEGNLVPQDAETDTERDTIETETNESDDYIESQIGAEL